MFQLSRPSIGFLYSLGFYRTKGHGDWQDGVKFWVVDDFGNCLPGDCLQIHQTYLHH